MTYRILGLLVRAAWTISSEVRRVDLNWVDTGYWMFEHKTDAPEMVPFRSQEREESQDQQHNLQQPGGLSRKAACGVGISL